MSSLLFGTIGFMIGSIYGTLFTNWLSRRGKK